MNKCEISVIMPVYKVEEEYLQCAINSILNQTFTNIELIIVVDYFDDDTINILRSYTDKRIVLIENEERAGLAGSLNIGIRHATGKYIARMDSDDVAMPKRLEWQYAYMESHKDTVICGGNVKVIDKNGRRIGKLRYYSTPNEIRTDSLFTCPFAHPTVMFNAEVLRQNDIFYKEDFRAEDYELWSRLVFHYEIACINRELLSYRVYDGSTTEQMKTATCNSAAEVQRNIFERFHIDFPHNKDIILNGVEDEISLGKVENALLSLILNDEITFINYYVLRRRMDVVYRKTEKIIGKNLCKQKRFFNVFGEAFHKNFFARYLDLILYGIKDIAWKIVYKE